MPRQTAIAFDDAVRLVEVEQMKCFEFGLIGKHPGECLWYDAHFVEWISSLGYHIELTGDEFEPYVPNETLV